MNRKLISIVALAAVSVGLAAAAPHADLVAAQKARIAEMKKSPKAKPHVAFVSNGVADFWTIAKAGAIAAGKELGCDVTVEFPGGGLGDRHRWPGRAHRTGRHLHRARGAVAHAARPAAHLGEEPGQ